MWVGIKMCRIARGQLIHTIFSHQLGQLDTWSSDNLKAFHLTGQKDEEKKIPILSQLFLFLWLFSFCLYEIPLYYTPTLFNVVCANYNGWQFLWWHKINFYLLLIFSHFTPIFFFFLVKTWKKNEVMLLKTASFFFSTWKSCFFFFKKRKLSRSPSSQEKKWKEKLK